MATTGSGSGGSQLFVRQSTGLVREASALDATIFNAVFSAPVGATLAFGLFWAYSAFPHADLVVGDDHLVLPQRPGPDHDGPARLEHAADRRRLRLGQPDPVAAAGPHQQLRRRAVGDDRGHLLGALLRRLGARPGPRVDRRGDSATRPSSSGGRNFSDQKDHQLWVFLGGFAMIALMTAILIAGTKTTFRWQNTFFDHRDDRHVRRVRRPALRQQRRLPGATSTRSTPSSAAGPRPTSSATRPGSAPTSATSARRSRRSSS